MNSSATDDDRLCQLSTAARFHVLRRTLDSVALRFDLKPLRSPPHSDPRLYVYKICNVLPGPKRPITLYFESALVPPSLESTERSSASNGVGGWRGFRVTPDDP